MSGRVCASAPAGAVLTRPCGRKGTRGSPICCGVRRTSLEHVDPAKRHVARALEAHWNAALERVAEVEQKLGHLSAQISSQPRVDPAVLMQLASDLPFVWNAAGTDARARQRLVRLLIEEVVNDIDAEKNEFVLLLHWIGGRHTEVRLARRKTGRFPPGQSLVAGEILRKLGGHWPDREMAVTLNRMRYRTEDGETWTTVRVAALRDSLAIPPMIQRRRFRRP